MATPIAFCQPAMAARAQQNSLVSRIHRIVPGAGHNVPEEAPETSAAAVMELIQARRRLGRLCRMVKPFRKPSSSLCKSSEKDKEFYGAEFHGEASRLACDRGLRPSASIAPAFGLRNSPAVRSPGSCPSRRAASPTRHRASSPRKCRGRSANRLLIDNRGGGGGTVGTEQVARARPDGYTMIYGTQGTMAANVTLRKNLSYDPLTSFLPVHLVGESPNLFVAYHGAPYNSVPEFIAYAKAESGQGDVLLLRRRHRDASGRRIVQDGHRHRDAACALPGQRAGTERHDRRPRRCHVRLPGLGWPACRGGQAEGAGHDRAGTPARVP